MPSFSLTVAHRPVRVGLLVRAGSADDFVEAVSVCTSLWGGLHNPILPVSETGENPWIETIVRRFQVDVLAPASDSSAFSEITEGLNHLRWPFPVNEEQPLLSELGRRRSGLLLGRHSAPSLALLGQGVATRLRDSCPAAGLPAY